MRITEVVLSFFNKIFKSRAFVPFTLFLLVLTLFSVTYQFIDKSPRIDSVEPSVAEAGSIVTITGEYFGDERNGGSVTVAGSRITSGSYKEWNDTTIRFVVPSDAGSGMVVVSNEKGRSKGALFSNKALIPVVLSGPLKPGLPYIESVEPSQGPVGTLVTVRGLNFGFEQGESLVYFSQQDLSGQTPQEGVQPERLPASLLDYDYASWTDQEIRVYVPDGATSGGLSILTDRGDSNAQFFEVKAGPGSKIFTGRRGYQIAYDVDVFSPRGGDEAILDLWIPRLYVGLEQRNVEWSADPVPLWSNYYGTMRYHYDGIAALGNQTVTQNYWFERYSLETDITVSQVKNSYNTDRQLYQVYTRPDTLVQITDDLEALAERLTRRQPNPYRKARILYDYLIDSLEFASGSVRQSPGQALETGKTDAYNYALLFSALSRAAGIPARPVAGYLVYNNKVSVRHYWAEFYLEDFGWLPVDPVLGEGVQFGNFPQLEEQKPEEYYFGNLDNQHITFSRGVVPLKSLLPRGKTKYQDRMYGLQTFHEEASGLDSYDTLWEDIRIIEWW